MLVFVFSVVFGGVLGFWLDVVGEKIVVDNIFEVVEDVVLFVVVCWLVELIVFVCIFFIVFEMLFDIDVVEFRVLDMIVVFDFGVDVFLFGVKEVELFIFFVVFLFLNEMFDEVWRVLVFVFGVVIGLELGFIVDVVEEDIIVEDWFKLFEDVIWFVVFFWLVRFIVVVCIFFMVFEMLFVIDDVDLNVVELEILLIVRVVDGNVFVCLIEVVNEDCVFVVFFEVMEVEFDLLGIIEIEFLIVCLFGWMVDDI